LVMQKCTIWYVEKNSKIRFQLQYATAIRYNLNQGHRLSGKEHINLNTESIKR
jgi:hypothetical protein